MSSSVQITIITEKSRHTFIDVAIGFGAIFGLK